jgi:hypothetical protein
MPENHGFTLHIFRVVTINLKHFDLSDGMGWGGGKNGRARFETWRHNVEIVRRDEVSVSVVGRKIILSDLTTHANVY